MSSGKPKVPTNKRLTAARKKMKVSQAPVAKTARKVTSMKARKRMPKVPVAAVPTKNRGLKIAAKQPRTLRKLYKTPAQAPALKF